MSDDLAAPRRLHTRVHTAQKVPAHLPSAQGPFHTDDDFGKDNLRHLEKLAEQAPERAREALGRVLGPVALYPVEIDGKRSYEARGAMNLDPAAFSGDRVGASEKGGCGGRI